MPADRPDASFTLQSSGLDLGIQALFPGEQMFLELAMEEPSFAGLHMENGTLIVSVSDSDRASAARSAVEARIDRFRGGRGANLLLDTRTVDYSFLDLAKWRNTTHGIANAVDDVVSLDLDERTNRVEVGLETGAGRAEVEHAAQAAGVPLEALTFVAAEPGVPLTETLDDHETPLPGGYYIYSETNSDPVGGCSAGFVARRYPSGTSVLVTSSHCSSDIYDLDNSRVFNYDIADTTHFLGVENRDPDPTGTCLGEPCRTSDASLFNIPADSADFGYIARTTRTGPYSGSDTIDSSNPRYEIVATTPWAVSGDTLHKVGHTTGATWGVVDDTCAEKQLDDARGDYSVSCTYTVEHMFAAGGDSGSPVFYWDGFSGDEVVVVGILFGEGDTPTRRWFSNYLSVTTDLGLLQVFEEPLEAFIPGPWEVEPNVTCTFYSNVWGGRAPYSYSWTGALSGSGSTVVGSLEETDDLYLLVTDANSNQDLDIREITVDEEISGCLY